ncbi:hypothetical protein VQ02_15135 [Methylobacterium variabile]|jgi:hypothetical protein|uniref:Uncharacterized protein n=1 Tax=Methylobacterium variabile TaxID=298794 RepID=A0A0J6STB1_9HYPH|nr:hypothetical protein VQ02_15135 [Methylobacterium variabile]
MARVLPLRILALCVLILLCSSRSASELPGSSVRVRVASTHTTFSVCVYYMMNRMHRDRLRFTENTRDQTVRITLAGGAREPARALPGDDVLIEIRKAGAGSEIELHRSPATQGDDFETSAAAAAAACYPSARKDRGAADLLDATQGSLI